MKNRLPFAAMTLAFTIAGACIGYGMHATPVELSIVVSVVAFLGAVAAALSGDLGP